MFSPAINALNDNLARATRVRDRRNASSLDIHGMPTRMIGGPAVDPRWDAFFGALQEQDQAADAAGLGFRVNLNSLGARRPSAALSGLHSAFGR